MQPHRIIRSQYHAALAMLKNAVLACPDDMWDQPRGDQPRFWQVAYHALFYTHLYLQETEDAFRPWAGHKAESHRLAADAPVEPYSQADVLEYLAFCQQQVDEQTARLNPEAPSGFDWLPFNKLELQFYTIRHIQHHTGELMERMGSRAQQALDWVGMQPD